MPQECSWTAIRESVWVFHRPGLSLGWGTPSVTAIPGRLLLYTRLVSVHHWLQTRWMHRGRPVSWQDLLLVGNVSEVVYFEIAAVECSAFQYAVGIRSGAFNTSGAENITRLYVHFSYEYWTRQASYVTKHAVQSVLRRGPLSSRTRCILWSRESWRLVSSLLVVHESDNEKRWINFMGNRNLGGNNISEIGDQTVFNGLRNLTTLYVFAAATHLFNFSVRRGCFICTALYMVISWKSCKAMYSPS